MPFNFGEMPRWISCSMCWSILVFISSKVINCIMLWEQNIFLVGTRYYIEGTRNIFFFHGLNQPPYFSEAFVIFLYALKLIFLLSHIFLYWLQWPINAMREKKIGSLNIISCSHTLFFPTTYYFSPPRIILLPQYIIFFPPHIILLPQYIILFPKHIILLPQYIILFPPHIILLPQYIILFPSHIILLPQYIFCSHPILSVISIYYFVL